MTRKEYINRFLNNTEYERWSEEDVDFVIDDLFPSDVNLSVDAFLKSRENKRIETRKNRLSTEEREVFIQVELGKDIYELPEYLSIKSVSYEGNQIPHKTTSTCLENMSECEIPLRSYNTSGLATGQIRIHPMPSIPAEPETPEDECPGQDENTDVPEGCKMVMTTEPLHEYYYHGWGYLMGDTPPDEPSERCVYVPDTEDSKNPEEKVQVRFGKLRVVYVVEREINFEDNGEELRREALGNSLLLKHYVPYQLLSHDTDDVSRSLSATEYQLYEQTLNKLFEKYTDSYVVDSVLEVEAIKSGRIDVNVDKSVDNVEAENYNKKAVSNAEEMNAKTLENRIRREEEKNREPLYGTVNYRRF